MFIQQKEVIVNKFIGFLVVAGIGGYFLCQNRQAAMLVLGAGGVILAVLVFLALVCYGFQMLRLFFKI